MKVGIIADTHDNIPKIKKALAAFAARHCEALIHAGDIISPFAAKALRAAKLPIHAIYGNNDGERKGLADLLPGICDGPRLLELDGKKILVAHSIAQVSESARAGVDLVIVGHTHVAGLERTKPLVLNPGECGGWLYGRHSVAVLDTARLAIEEIPLD
jgi:putative phosphoesterase